MRRCPLPPATNCAQIGPIIELVVVRNKVGQQSKGCAFVWYATRQHAEDAIGAFNLQHVLPDPTGQQQRPLVVRKARTGHVLGGMLARHASAASGGAGASSSSAAAAFGAAAGQQLLGGFQVGGAAGQGELPRAVAGLPGMAGRVLAVGPGVGWPFAQLPAGGGAAAAQSSAQLVPYASAGGPATLYHHPMQLAQLPGYAVGALQPQPLQVGYAPFALQPAQPYGGGGGGAGVPLLTVDGVVEVQQQLGGAGVRGGGGAGGYHAVQGYGLAGWAQPPYAGVGQGGGGAVAAAGPLVAVGVRDAPQQQQQQQQQQFHQALDLVSPSSGVPQQHHGFGSGERASSASHVRARVCSARANSRFAEAPWAAAALCVSEERGPSCCIACCCRRCSSAAGLVTTAASTQPAGTATHALYGYTPVPAPSAAAATAAAAPSFSVRRGRGAVAAAPPPPPPPAAAAPLPHSVAFALDEAQLSTLNRRVFEVQQATGASLLVAPGGPGTFTVMVAGQTARQVEQAQALVASILCQGGDTGRQP